MTARWRTISWVLVFVAIGVAGATWFTPRPDLDAGQAADVAVAALADAGHEATVPETPVRLRHETEDGTIVPVWDVTAEVGDDAIELRVLVDSGRLVFVDDRIGPDRSERLLTDAEFASLAAFRDDPTLGGWVLRNLAVSVGGVVLALVSYTLARRADPLWRTASWT